jgi:hypothetical protein
VHWSALEFDGWKGNCEADVMVRGRGERNESSLALRLLFCREMEARWRLDQVFTVAASRLRLL